MFCRHLTQEIPPVDVDGTEQLLSADVVLRHAAGAVLSAGTADPNACLLEGGPMSTSGVDETISGALSSLRLASASLTDIWR